MYHVRSDYDGIQDATGKTSIAKDEPVFLLRGKDKLAGDVVEHWADLLEETGGNQDTADRVRLFADQMRRFAENNGGKIPDTPAEALKSEGDLSAYEAKGHLQAMGEQVAAWAERKGWEPDPERQFAAEMMLVVSEAAEALEAYRAAGFSRWFVNDSGNTFHLLEGDPANYQGFKPEGVASEMADILIRLLHYAHAHGIDLQAEFDAKMKYNETRAYRHGGRRC